MTHFAQQSLALVAAVFIAAVSINAVIAVPPAHAAVLTAPIAA